ncbi:MAG: AAA family ATPase [Myxococcales bacterium]|jgi:ATP-dependent Clp protease ATP-binding subunit ClpC
MICENCGVRPATLFVQQRDGNKERAAAFCNRCASASGGALRAGEPLGLDSLLEGMLGTRPKARENLLASLNPRARQVLQRAARLTLAWGQERVQNELLLLALVDEVQEISQALQELGLKGVDFERQLHKAIGKTQPRRAEGIGLAPGVKRVLQLAKLQAVQMGASQVGPEHLLLAIMVDREGMAAGFLARVDPNELRARLAGGAPGVSPTGRLKHQLPQNLSRFGRDLTTLAQGGGLDPIIGREGEIERIIRILSRRTKNNPVLIGEPGVGKTSIVEGLAQRIAAGEVPELLRGKRVVSLDLGAMVAGTKFRGEFEARFKGLMEEIRALNGKILLFIDELHTIVGAGAAEGAIDASSMLKPALARGELQCLGATTLDEYRKYVEKDPALERRFQPVMVAEPTQEQTLAILRGLRPAYKAHHQVKISDGALDAAVELSDRYVNDRFLPDKAIDVLDEAAAMVRLGARFEPSRLQELAQPLAQLEHDKKVCVAEERYLEAARLKASIDALSAELEALRKVAAENERGAAATVLPEHVATVIAEWTGIPATRLQKEEAERLIEMERSLAQRVVGQEDAIRAVAEAVRRARAGLKDPNRPIGSFIFLGPTGVGKTETARALAEYLFNDEEAMIRLDMSEFMERHTVSRLVGAPPGYVGYEEAGKLTEAVRRRPYSVLLFDEIEKAHPDVFNILLQILDDGRLTDAKGRTVNFKNTIVIMTSNVGAESIAWRGTLGFQAEAGDGAEQKARQVVLDAMREQFRPEFLNRIDEIVVFHPLGREQIRRIVENMLETTRRKLRGQDLRLAMTDAALDALAERGFEPRYGARPLRRAIQREIETVVSQMMLDGTAREGDEVRVDFANGRFDFVVHPRRLSAAGGPPLEPADRTSPPNA